MTPEALANLEIEPQEYPLGFMTFDQLHLHWKRFTFRLNSRQHSIRRYEFDDYLLRRCGADVREHRVRRIERANGNYVIDGEYRGKYLIGAGGTRCPVYHAFFQERNPRRAALQTATLEKEFAYDWKDPACHLWFFDDGLPGYAWYVPKANGYINIGLGGMAGQLKRKGGRLRDYWRGFVSRLNRKGLVVCEVPQPKGYSYYLRGKVDCVRVDDAFITGDAAGLATRDMCEGIGPAVESGLLAARSIIDGAGYSLAGVGSLSSENFAGRYLARTFAGEKE